MKTFAFALILMISLGASAEINSTGVLGFQAWKTQRIDEARTTLEKIQAEAQPQAAKPQEAKKKYQQFQQAQLNLQIVQELTISDYFTLYLSQLKDRSSMLDAARKLSADEIADLMVAYQKALSPSASNDERLPLLAAPTRTPSTKQN